MRIDGDESAEPSIDILTDRLTARARAAAIAYAALLETAVEAADREPVGFDTDLVAFTLAWSQSNARWHVEFGRYLQRVIKPVWSALCDGDLDVARARVFHDVLVAVDDDLALVIAVDFVARASGWTTGQLRDRLRRAVLRVDPNGAAERTARTVEHRRLMLAAEQHSTASMFASCLPAARAVAAFERVDAFARARRADGDERTLDQLRADTFLDLLEGVSLCTSPVNRRGVVEISVPWSILARNLNPDECPGSNVAHDGFRDGRAEPSAEPAVLAGFGPIEAPLGHDLVAGMIGRHDVQWRFRVDGADGELHRIGVLPRPRDRDDLRRCLEQIRHTALAKSGPPVEAGPRRRTPGPALSRWIRARDGTCRAPGCRVPASVCDIDHTVDHFSGGLTTHDNLALLCRHHHRLKHEAGWHVQQPRPGALVWTSPYGQRFGRPAD